MKNILLPISLLFLFPFIFNAQTETTDLEERPDDPYIYAPRHLQQNPQLINLRTATFPAFR